MNRFLIAIPLLLLCSGAFAEIYKCENKSTGEIEYKDSPCTNEQVRGSVSESVGKSLNIASGPEGAALQAMVKQDRNTFQEVCEEQLDRGRLSESQYNRRCEAALKKQAQCRVDAMKKLPRKVSAAYFSYMEQNMTHDQAASLANSDENWGGMSSEEAMQMTLPIAASVSECIQKIFE